MSKYTIEVTEEEAKAAYIGLQMAAQLGPTAMGSPELMQKASDKGPEFLMRIVMLAAVANTMRDVAIRLRKAVDPKWEPEAPLAPGEKCPDCGKVHVPLAGAASPEQELTIPDNVIPFPGPKTKQ